MHALKLDCFLPAGLPNSVAWLGWVAGPICICAFFCISLWSSIMLAGMYRIGNTEFARYHHLVRMIRR